ncbi:hypothetical protein HRI_004876100 [Hibiscus trionum]|uniref:Uncharacterized protein n=1 Tax=Hibiscus trionum TaxID=183268 RepID=A0A9W7MRE1_HIBTR|nr:hypothetical protein HRI_004876100 [Hibiscus trionum]
MWWLTIPSFWIHVFARKIRCKDQDKPPERIFRVTQEKAKSLGLNFIPRDLSLRETIESLKKKGFSSI